MTRKTLSIFSLATLAVTAVLLISNSPILAKPLMQGSTPQVTHGPISGEVTDSSVVLWARGNLSGTLTFEVSETDVFTDAVSATTEVTANDDFTGEVQLANLTPSQTYFYRVTLEGSESVTGQFRTAPPAAEPTAFDFVFGACLGGQGYCRSSQSSQTGWEIFEAMATEEPDFFLLTGDTIYASSACPVPDNIAGAEEPAQDLAGFRDRYKYHLEDEAYANFLAQTPVYVTWDDHEVRDNYSGKEMAAQNPERLLAGQQSFFEYWPVQASDVATDTYQLYRSFSYGSLADFFILDTRSYRDPIVNWDPHPRTFEPKTMLGAEQFAWLQQSLAESDATWKFIVTSVPLSYPTGFPQPEVEGRDSWANFTDKSGYETELLALTFFLESQGIDNVVFLTGDTHWPFSISYDPDRNSEPNFYEFGSSPLSAIVLPPAPDLDPTLNPTVRYAEGEFQGDLFNFGHIGIEESGALTFRVIDREGIEHFSQTIQPE